MQRGDDIVYVWIHEQGNDHAPNDLKYSLRSVEEMWMGSYRITVVGDDPTKLTDLWKVPHTRTKTDNRPKALDAVNKMRVICSLDHLRDRFILMYDDICFLQPMDVSYLEVRRGVEELLPDRRPGRGKHHAILADTEKALREAGVRRVWNYETHLPRVFEKRKMLEVIERFKPDENRLMLPTLYFNWHWKNQPPTLMNPLDNIMARFVGPPKSRFDTPPAPMNESERAVPYYREKMTGKYILNWNNDGINRIGLQFARHGLFPDPSSHEFTDHLVKPKVDLHIVR